MAGNGRFRLAIGLALGASLAFLVFLLVRPVSDGSVRLTANPAQLAAPLAAAASRAAASGSGHARRAWTLLAIPLAAAAMLSFPGRTERAALQARSLLDGAVIAASLLYTSWAFVLGPVFRAGEGSVLEQAIALAYPAGDVVLVTIVFVVVARVRVGGVPVMLLGAGLVSLAVADTGFAYLTQEGAYQTGSPTDVGWFAGYLLVAAAAWRPAAVGSPGWVGGRAGSRCCCPMSPWPWP